MRNVAQTAALMAVFTLISKLLGFVRETVMAACFGAGNITDAYVMATSIPNIIFAGVFSAIATAYLPLYSRINEQEGEDAGNRYTNEVVNLLLIVSLISGVVGLIFSDQIVSIFARGFVGERAALTSFFVKITFSYVIFTSTSGILESYLRYKNMFLPQIVIGYSQNCIMITMILISAYSTYYLLAFGLLISYALRLFLLAWIAKKQNYSYHVRRISRKTICQISTMAIPVFIGSSADQINQFVDKTLASGLAEGSVSALNYANIIIGLISGLTVTILTTITYPKLAQASALKDGERFNAIFGTGINLILIIAVPFSIGAIVFHEQVVQVIYERGAFDPVATALTGTAVFCYAIGLAFSSMIGLMVQVFYSNYDSKSPVYAGFFAVVINIALNLLLVGSLKHNGLALATSIANIGNFLLLCYMLRKKYPQIHVIKSVRTLITILAASLASVGAAAFVYFVIGGMVWLPRMVWLGLAVMTAGICYLILLLVFKVEELQLLKGLRKR